ncbi:MAG: 3,4-dihydroxy-2-butanone-4-phosphate synthase [Halobacteriales archaeon]|nr:3,4-dihydroxy-2-butanone-4-phosphate synthase [Halobacteriales archaeon]
MSQRGAAAVERAVSAFERGEPVCVHDAADREGETDLVVPASAVTPDLVATLRNDAGGLVCVALADPVADAFELPFAADAVDHPASGGPVHYDERSSFSLSVNHVDTYTGITDRDRARTITELGAAAEAALDGGYGVEAFAESFRAPGHVHLLRAAPTLDDRQGHTELAVALAEAAGREPAAVVCEMLDDVTGEALTPADARAYAERRGLAYVEGASLIDAFA